MSAEQGFGRLADEVRRTADNWVGELSHEECMAAGIFAAACDDLQRAVDETRAASPVPKVGMSRDEYVERLIEARLAAIEENIERAPSSWVDDLADWHEERAALSSPARPAPPEPELGS